MQKNYKKSDPTKHDDENAKPKEENPPKNNKKAIDPEAGAINLSKTLKEIAEGEAGSTRKKAKTTL
jgi:hypothetical protein